MSSARTRVAARAILWSSKFQVGSPCIVVEFGCSPPCPHSAVCWLFDLNFSKFVTPLVTCDTLTLGMPHHLILKLMKQQNWSITPVFVPNHKLFALKLLMQYLQHISSLWCVGRRLRYTLRNYPPATSNQNMPRDCQTSGLRPENRPYFEDFTRGTSIPCTAS